MFSWVKSLFSRKPRAQVVEADAVSHLVRVLQGEREFQFGDGTRCDIRTRDLVVEVDHAHKWYEGIGQVLHYHVQSGQAGLLVLLWEKDREQEYIVAAHRVITTLRAHGLPVFLLDVRFREGVPSPPDEFAESFAETEEAE